jgi:cytochrome c peroxidase
MALAMCAAGACGSDGGTAGPAPGEPGNGGDGGPGEQPGPDDVPDDVGVPEEPLPSDKPEHLLTRASKSGTIDISEDDRFVAMVLPESDALALFSGEDEQLLSLVSTGDEPSAVVLHPDLQSAFVANRAAATVVRIDGIDGGAPRVSAPVPVGSEPTGLALSPGGTYLYVAEHAEGRVSVFATKTMKLVAVVDAPEHPFALAVTNDGDDDEGDELLVVPEFFGEAAGGGEATNDGRKGRVRLYGALDLKPRSAIELAPIDSGFAPDGAPAGTPSVLTSPNQLSSAVVQNGKVYLTSVSASPAAPVVFNSNVFPVMYVADLATGQEDRGPAGTINLAVGVREVVPEGEPKLFLADLVDMAFVADSQIGYALSRGADAIQRVVFEPGGVTFGSTQNAQIDLLKKPAGSERACQAPTGIVTRHQGTRAYVNCWITRALGVVDLASQSLAAVANADALPGDAEGEAVALGKRFFFTGRGRWSKEAWSSCASCHPGGLSDGITWAFPAGPRQTTSLDGSFSHGPGEQQQRIFNWTGIFDELHDFERNTRGVSGGLGAVTSSPAGTCGQLATEQPKTLGGNLAQPVKEVQDEPDGCTTDFDDIDAYVRTIRPPRGLRTLDEAAVARGAKLFGAPTASESNGNCVACHGGKGFTASRRFFTPSSATNAALASEPFEPPAAWPASWNQHVVQIANQPLASDPSADAAGPNQVACVLRNVDSFGVPGDDALTASLELRDNGKRAQGAGGFNIPSLYGLSLGAPYLHHGQAQSLEELFEDPAWATHLRAGNAVFLSSGDAAQQRDDLRQYLLSIDATTPERAIPAGFDGCPDAFSAD